MKDKNRLRKAGTVFFYVGLLIELLIVILDKSDFTIPYLGQLFRVTFALFALKICLTRYSLKEWAVLLACAAAGIVSYGLTGRNELLRIMIFVAACKEIEIKKALKLAFWLTSAACAVLMVLSLTGVYGTLSLTQEFGRGQVETRYCIGLGHPNSLHGMFFALTALGLFLYFDRLRWYALALLLGTDIGLFLLTDSKTGVAATAFVLLAAAAMKAWKGKRADRWIFGCCVLLTAACLVFSLVSSFWGIDIPLFVWMDEKLLTGRIMSSYLFGRGWRWTAFSLPESVKYFDMGFMKLFYWYGVVPGLLYVAAMLLLLRDLGRRRDRAGLLLFAAVTLYTVVEAHFISVYLARNYLLFLMGAAWCGWIPGNKGEQAYLWQCGRLFRKKES